jgi:hypothetical protein
VLVFVAATCYGADEVEKATRKLDGEKTTFPAMTITEGLKAMIGAIESCSASTWGVKKPFELADLEKAQKGDHVRFVFSKPITLTVMRDKVEVSEVVFSAGAFWLRTGKKVLYCSKYQHEKMKTFETWYRQTLPVDPPSEANGKKSQSPF